MSSTVNRRRFLELSALTKQKEELGPKTDDELWEWVRDNLGIEIPRVAVCAASSPA